MKKIFKIHLLTYIVPLIAALTGHFRIYLSFMLLIIVHELGHIITGLMFKWKLKEIDIMPLGMISKFHTLINVSMIEEITVAWAGVIVQLIFYYLFLKGSAYYDMCNRIIIIFNLLPIMPLDGSKIFNIILNKILSFKTSYLISFYLSLVITLIIIVFGLIYSYLIMIIIFIPLLIGLFSEYKKIPSVINKFYLERYLYKFKYKKTKSINKLSDMQREHNHLLNINNMIYKEEEFLKKTFDKD